MLLELTDVGESLVDVLLCEDALDEFLVILWCVEAGEDPHHLVEFPFLFGSGLIDALLFFGVEEVPADEEVLAADAFGEPHVVYLHEAEFHVLLLIAIVIVELQLSQQQLRIVIVFHLELEPLRHVAYHLSRIRRRFHAALHGRNA